MATRTQRRRMAVERLEDRSTPSLITDYRFNDGPGHGHSAESNSITRSDHLQGGPIQGPHDSKGAETQGPVLCNGPAYTGETGSDKADHSGSSSSSGWDLPYYV